MNRPPVQKVSRAEIRQRFSDGAYLPRLAARELRAEVVRENPVTLRSGQPPGSTSQTIELFDGPKKVARMHQYVLPDGSIGGSGVPEPKVLYEDDVIYASF